VARWRQSYEVAERTLHGRRSGNLIEAWHDPVWATQNAEHPFAYITTAFRNAGLLAAEVARLAPVALIRKGKRFALVPFDATPERRQELLTALEK
jgi:hypothetical protein